MRFKAGDKVRIKPDFFNNDGYSLDYEYLNSDTVYNLYEDLGYGLFIEDCKKRYLFSFCREGKETELGSYAVKASNFKSVTLCFTHE